jgi:hypothetical protein
MSIWPSAAAACSIMARTEASSPVSTVSGTIFRPVSARSSAAVASRVGTSRAAIATSTPSSAS